MSEINRNPAPREIRRTGWVLLIGFGVIGLLLWRAGRPTGSGWGWAGTGRQMAALAAWVTGALAGAACLTSPAWGRRVYVAWMTLGGGIGRIVTAALLSALFFVFLPVFSLIRLKDPLCRRRGSGESYWRPHRPQEPTLDRMARPF